MKPLNYIKKDGITTFLYSPERLAEWFELGFKEGNVGMILLKRAENSHTYMGFGTIENPCKVVQFMTLIDNPVMDGKRRTDDEIINPPPVKESLSSYSFQILDFGKV